MGELSEQWGVKKLKARLNDPDHEQYFGGLYPKDHPKNMRFSINYFTAIGLGVLTEDLRKHLETVGPQFERERKAMAIAESEDESSSDSDSSSSSDSSDSSSSS